VADSWLGPADEEVAGAEDDEEEGAAWLSGRRSSSPVSRNTSRTPRPDTSTAAPTMIQGSRPFFFPGGGPYPPGGNPPGPGGGAPNAGGGY
jgi:hypothetical protein